MMRGFKGWALVIATGLYLVAVVVLVIMNLGNEVNEFHVYWQTRSIHLGALILLSMGLGILAWWSIRGLIRGIKLIRQSRKTAHIKQLEADAKQREKNAEAEVKAETKVDEPITGE